MPTISDFEWFIKGKQLGIAKQSSSSDSMTAGGGGSIVRYTGPRYPAPFTEGALTQESEIPEQFHRGLVAYVLMTEFEDIGDERGAAIQEKIWKKAVSDGKIMADDDLQTSAVEIRPHTF